MLGIKELHEKILYPTILVRTEKAGGSGTVIKSVEVNGEWRSYILTNHHVVSEAIKFAEKWDSLVGRDIKVEVKAPVFAEFYEYRRWSILDRADSRRADVVAWDKDHDVALLELISGKPPEYVATMLPKGQIAGLRMFMPIIACGCAMGHKPIATMGYITSLDERIENLQYWLANTPTIFGNSGGGQFLSETGEFIGIPSRLDVALVGYSASAITHLSYMIPISRIYDLLEDWHYEFIYDETQTFKECEEKRKEKQDALQRAWERRWRRERQRAMGGASPESEEEGGDV